MPRHSTFSLSDLESLAKRDCPVCGERMTQRPDEPTWLWAKRKTCGKKSCANDLLRQAKQHTVDVTCVHCGATFALRPCEVHDSGNFCSRACYWESMKRPRTCLTCGQLFTGGERNNYCSKTCAGKARQRRQEFTCPICGKKRIDAVCKAKRRESMYCSRSCAGIAAMQKRSNTGKATSIELATYAALDEMGIAYERQAAVGPWAADAFVPSLNLVIEVMGDYYHVNPKVYPNHDSLTRTQRNMLMRDRRKFGYYKANGYRVIKLWERDIKQLGALAILQAALGR